MHLVGADPRWLQSIEVQGSGLIVRRILSVGVRSLRQRPSLAAPSPIVLHSAIWYCVGACRQVLWLSGPARGLSACSVGWFVSLLVRLCEREVLLVGSREQ